MATIKEQRDLKGWEGSTHFTYKPNIEARSYKHCCSRKAALHILDCQSVSVALVTQHTMRSRRLILSSVASLALRCFSTLSHKGTIFWYKLLNIKYVLFSLQILSETFLILTKIRQDIINKCLQVLHVKNIRYSCRILMKLQSSRETLEEYSNIKCHENPLSGSPVVPCRRTDRQT